MSTGELVRNLLRWNEQRQVRRASIGVTEKAKKLEQREGNEAKNASDGQTRHRALGHVGQFCLYLKDYRSP